MSRIYRRGPLRKLVEVGGDFAHPTFRLSCGHVADLNPVFSYKVGSDHSCYQCAKLHTCHGCGGDADVAGRVYSGIVGPFCSVQCRDDWAALEDT